jgi:hypothetical protein
MLQWGNYSLAKMNTDQGSFFPGSDAGENEGPSLGCNGATYP